MTQIQIPWFHKQKYTGCLSRSKTTAQPNLTSAHGNNGVVLKTAEKLGTTNPAGGERPPGGGGRHLGRQSIQDAAKQSTPARPAARLLESSSFWPRLGVT